MKRSEQRLLYILIGAAVVGIGLNWAYSSFIKPIELRQDDLISITKKNDEKADQLIVLAAQRKKLKEWKSRSLPPDPTKPNQRPDALNAQRLYQDWLHDLATLSGFEDLKVSPDRRSVSRGNVYVSVVVRIEADARFDQLCHFLDRFYRTELLHRITSLRVQSKEAEGNPFLQVTLEAEGLAILDAPENRRLFPQTLLADDLLENIEELTVESSDGFTPKPGNLIRIQSEYLKVTAVNGNTWTVERGKDETLPANHAVGTIVELARVDPKYVERTADEFKSLIEANVFVKPAPPVRYTPKFGPLGEKVFIRGRPIDFTIVLLGFDPSKGRPEFSLLSPQMAGMRIDKGTGRFSWSPPSQQKTGTYLVKFEVKHPSVAGGKLQGTATVVVRDPNSPPKLSADVIPVVYLGRPWKFTPQASDAESPTSRLTWKLGDNSPAGMKIDSATGELSWTPDDTVEPGDVSVQVTATDDGTPALSSNISLKIPVEDDCATFTRLTGIFAKDQDVRALLYDRSRDTKTELRVGNRFAVADIKGTVILISKKYLIFSDGDSARRLELGQSLRETRVESLQPADATKPANGVTEEY